MSEPGGKIARRAGAAGRWRSPGRATPDREVPHGRCSPPAGPGNRMVIIESVRRACVRRTCELLSYERNSNLRPTPPVAELARPLRKNASPSQAIGHSSHLILYPERDSADLGHSQASSKYDSPVGAPGRNRTCDTPARLVVMEGVGIGMVGAVLGAGLGLALRVARGGPVGRIATAALLAALAPLV